MVAAMSFEKVLEVTQQLTARMEALSAMGARLQGREIEPAMGRALDGVLAAIGVDQATLAALAPEQKGAVLGFIRAFMRQAVELVEHPERATGWAFEDPVILNGIGRGSMSLAPVIAQIASTLGDLGSRLGSSKGAFLDVGTGAGWLAMALAKTFPSTKVTGIDIWGPALALARENTAPLAGRIEIREQDVTTMPDKDAYDAAFLAGPFFPARFVPDAVRRIRDALKPGGWILFALFAAPPDPVAQALNDLRVVRFGGHPWRPDEVVELLTGAGYVEARAVERTWAAPGNFIVGRRA